MPDIGRMITDDYGDLAFRIPTTSGTLELHFNSQLAYVLRISTEQRALIESANISYSVLEVMEGVYGLLFAPRDIATVCSALDIKLQTYHEHESFADTIVLNWVGNEAAATADPEPEETPAEPAREMTPFGYKDELIQFRSIYNDVKDEDGCPAVVITDWNGMKRDYRENLFNKIVGKMKNWTAGLNFTNIAEIIRKGALPFKYLRITVPHGKQSPIMLDRKDTVTVHIWGTPEDTSAFTPESIGRVPEYVTGCRPGVRDYCFPQPDGTVPVFEALDSDDMGNVIAFMTDPQNIYIPFDSIHKNRTDDIYITTEIIMKAFAMIGVRDGEIKFTDKATSMIGKTPQEILFDRTHELFAKYFVNYSKVRLQELQAEVNSMHNNVTDYRTALLRTIRNLEIAKKSLEANKVPDEDIAEQAEIQFRQIMKNPKVDTVQAIDGGIMIMTNMLYAQDPRTSHCHEIGEMKIKIFFDGRYKYYNKTHRIDGYSDSMHGVHIFSDSQACLGNLEAAIPDLLSKMEIATVAGFLIDFACSINPDDAAGKYASKWPMVNFHDMPELFQQEFEMTKENEECQTADWAITRAVYKPAQTQASAA